MISEERQLENLLRNHGLTIAIETFYPSDHAAKVFVERLGRVKEEWEQRDLGQFDLTVRGIENWLTHSPNEAEAFLQALVSLQSPQIILAVLLAIRGSNVDGLELQYERLEKLRLTLRIGVHEYLSEDIYDAVVFSNLGKAKMGGKPLFDGFYALQSIGLLSLLHAR